jgi:subtilisin family serine protease
VEKVGLSLRNLLAQRGNDRAAAVAARDENAVAAADETILVKVYFEGDAEALAAVGFAIDSLVSGVGTAALTPQQITDLARLPQVHSILLPDVAQPLLDKSVPEIFANTAWAVGAAGSASGNGKGAGVIVGIVDSGIDVFHGAIRKPDGSTRILALWDQTFRFNAAGGIIDAQGNPLTGGDLPLDETGAILTRMRTPRALHPTFNAALNYGAEFSAAQINAALTAHPDGKDLPKSLQDQPVSNGNHDVHHGTHVAGIAAGNGAMNDKCTSSFTYVGVAPEADLVIVKAGVGTPPGAIQNLVHALQFCLETAAISSTAGVTGKPIVVNFSLGGHFGPHNGYEDEGRSFDALTAGILGIGRAIVVAAGNDRNVDLHAAYALPVNATRAQQLNLTMTDCKRVLVFGSYNVGASLTCRVKAPPDGGPVAQGTARNVAANNAAEPVRGHNVWVNVHPALGADPDRHFFVEIVNQTASNPVASGIWELEFNVPAAGPAVNLHLWIGSPGAYRVKLLPQAGDPQSVQDSARSIKRPPDWIAGTLTSLTTCRNVITVAAYNAEETNTPLAAFSAQGPAPHELSFGLYDPAHVLDKPDIAAPGVAIDAPRGMARKCCLECDCCVDRYIAEEGTSMAAPHVTGVVALMLAQKPTLTIDEIKDLLRANTRPPPTLPAGWPGSHELWGAGKVDTVAAVGAAIAHPRVSHQEDEAVRPAAAPVARPVAEPLSWPERLDEWSRAFGHRPAWNLCAALVSLHFDEVKRLIDSNRRVAAVWQRHGGPGLVRSLVFAPEPQDPPVPSALAAAAPRELIEKLLTILLRFGGPSLRDDIMRHGKLLQAMPGASWDELDRLVSGGAA